MDKQTDITTRGHPRALPEASKGWPIALLGDIAELRREGVNPRKADSERYIGLEHIDPAVLRMRRWGSPEEVRSGKSRFYPGDILYAKLRPYLDKGALAEWEGICSTDILVIKPGDKVDPYFLASYVHHPDFLAHATSTMTGVNHPRTSWHSLKSFPLFLPPIDEQRTIADVLRAVQQAKEATEKVIAASYEVKHSQMHHLFSYGPLPVEQAKKVKLKETDIGLVPEHWDVRELGDVTDFLQYGTNERADSNSVGVVVLGIPNVVKGFIDTGSLRYLQPSERMLKKLSLETGDLLFVRTNATRENVGRSVVYHGVPRPAIFASYLIRVRLKPNLIPEFLQFYSTTASGRSFLSRRATGAADGKFNINTQTIRSVVIPVPPLKEQEEIVRLASVMDEKIRMEKAKAQALRVIFAALIKELLSGERRTASLAASNHG